MRNESDKKRPIIVCSDFGFQYNAQQAPTLYNINLTIYQGEKILIAGPSGSGKSTLAHCINGLIPFSYEGEMTGSLTVGGIESREQSIFALSKTVGTVLQDPDGQFIGLTVGEDIAFALENDRTEQDEMKKIVTNTARLVDIQTHLRAAPHELSGGQKQRVSLAGVMVDRVEVLLFDEPLANLDPSTGKQAIELIDGIQKKLGTTVLIVEHRLEDVLHRPVDRIILMNEGRIVADLPPAELLATEKLRECGIREPLYLTALRYAGCTVTPEMRPQSVSLLEGAACKEQLRRWYETRPAHVAPLQGEELLRVEALQFHYNRGREVLKDISFSVQKGEMLSIVGKNGAGKSTLSKLVCGFERQQSGRIFFEGRDIRGDTIKERALRIGMVMQNPNQMISKNMIAEEVGLGLVVAGLPKEEVDERVERALSVCGLHPFRRWPISALSFGQKKRVTIASILALDPRMIILDEPTAGQDFRHYTEIMEFLRDLNRSGVTVIMITHDMHLMLEYTNRSLVFSGGRLIADRAPADILCDAVLIESANLKETSLFPLCEKTLPGIEPRQFVQRFIDYDRQVRGI